jgi:2-dehydropantoate 2-reductase
MPERSAAAPPLRFLFFGAGAVGSLLGARLAQAGSEVTLVGRASHVEAVTRDGVRMVSAGKVSSQSVRSARPTIAEAVGPFDYVFLTVKG